MMKVITKKVLSYLLVLIMICSIFYCNDSTLAKAKKAKLKFKVVNLKAGRSRKIQIRNKKKKAKYKFSSSSKSRVSVTKKGLIKAKKAGTAKITVREVYKKDKRKVGIVTVKVSKKNTVPTNKHTQPSVKPSITPTISPTINPSPTSTVTPSQTLKPIKPYIEDTNFDDLPVGYMNKKNGVEYGAVDDIQYESGATNSTRKAKVILPAGYDSDKQYPVLYLLHGIFGNETTLYNDNVQYTIGNAIADGVSEEMIVVLPNACANEAGSGDGFSLEHYSAYDNLINDLLGYLMPYMSEHYSVAEGRENTAIAGFSMGGRVSLQIGFKETDKFRYIGAFCPAFGLLEYTNYGVYEKGFYTVDTFKLPDLYTNDTLVQITAGPNDSIVRDEPERYHNALEGNNVPHIFYSTMGGDSSREGDGGHGGDVYKHGLYNFMRRIFHNY